MMRLDPATVDALVQDLRRAAVAEREATKQLGRDVREARRRGLTWDEVALGLGVSKQAAHRRFRSQLVAYDDRELPTDG